MLRWTLWLFSALIVGSSSNKWKSQAEESGDDLGELYYLGNTGKGKPQYGGPVRSTNAPVGGTRGGTSTTASSGTESGTESGTVSDTLTTAESGTVTTDSSTAVTGSDKMASTTMPKQQRKKRGCWLQIPETGRWVWNYKTYTNKCGGYVQLSNCKWQWTLHPDRFPLVTCFNMHLMPNGGNTGVGSGNTDGGNTGVGSGNTDGENAGVGSGNTDGENGGGDGNTDGEDGEGATGSVDEDCVCSDWDFPGECGSDSLIFRWRTCEPRYCAVEDEYVEC